MNSGQPRKEYVTARITSELRQRIRKLAEVEKRSESHMIAILLESALSNGKKK